MQRLLVSAAHKSSGKTTVTVGLAAAWHATGMAVQPFKKGPDYIDPMWLSLAAGREALNLDPHLMAPQALQACFDRGCAGADLALVEGNHGLYDGLALDGSNSNAALAHRLDLPVLLVVDCRGMTRGIAPLLLGYRAFDPALRFAGVVLNRVGGSRHESKLRAAIEHYTDWAVLGAVADDPRLSIVERHLGLMPCAEVGRAAERVQRIGAIVGSQVDLSRVIERASVARALEPASAALAGAAVPTAGAAAPRAGVGPETRPAGLAGGTPARRVGPTIRLGIARDRAFGFYYADDLQALREAGCELVFFDTLRDPVLPTVDALFIGGGFPETCLDELEANHGMRASIRAAIEAGLPAYAECGGLMYLSRGIEWQGRRATMVGAIPADTRMHARPVGRGYVELEPTAAMPWPLDAPVRAHEFHHSSLENVDPAVSYAWHVRRGHGIDGQRDGLRVHNLLASYAHLRDAAGTSWVKAFVQFAKHQIGVSPGTRPVPDSINGDTACST